MAVQYIDFNGEQTPILFGNAAFYHYEKRHKESGFAAFMQSVPQDETGNVDINKVKISFFIDITMCALIAGGNKERKPFLGIVDDVAAWMDNENMMTIMEMITDSLPIAKDQKDEATQQEAGE
jgi:hypothetical protein